MKTIREPLRLDDDAEPLTTSPTLALNEVVAARRAAGREIFDLGFGEASFALPPALRSAFAAAGAETSYGPVLGTGELREAIAGYLARERGLEACAAHVAVGPGSKPLLFALLRVLRGDVLLPTPSWVSYAAQAHLSRKRVIWVQTHPRDHHTLTTDALELARRKALRAGALPRILVVNTPSNPTGGVLTREAVAEIAAWARRTGVTLISDEVYAELVHGPRPHVSPATVYPEGTIVTGGLSKAFSAGGWRLGYALVPKNAGGGELVAALRAIASEIWSSPSMPAQCAAASAFRADPEVAAHVRRCARLHGHAAGRLARALTRLGVTCAPPAGAFYVFADFAPFADALRRRRITSSSDLARHLLDVWGIAALPGAAFGDAPSALRLRLATSKLFGAGEAEGALLPLADTLPAEDPASGTPLPLPLLDKATEALSRFIGSL
jgi:aspartate/methionine/tyrosine aminotransferase